MVKHPGDPVYTLYGRGRVEGIAYLPCGVLYRVRLDRKAFEFVGEPIAFVYENELINEATKPA